MISFFPFLAGIGLGFLFGLVAQSERHAARSAPVEVVRSLPLPPAIAIPALVRKLWWS